MSHPLSRERARRWVVAVIGLAIVWGMGALLAAAAGPILVTPTSPEGDGAPSVISFNSSVDDVTNPDVRRDLAARPAIITYTVQVGDTALEIAHRFGLTLDTLRWSNPCLEANPDLLEVGLDLVILPVDGVYHRVVAGDTLGGIAERYEVAVTDIIDYPLNQLAPGSHLSRGAWLIVPDGAKHEADQARASLPQPAGGPDPSEPQQSPSAANLDQRKLNPPPGLTFVWPLVGEISQYYHAGHRALDICAPYGSEIYAAEAGTVIHAAWVKGGYGLNVMIDHGDGCVTLYAHLKEALVQEGDRVERGQMIGQTGTTGNATGSHLHFEIRVNEVLLDPLAYLPETEDPE